MNLAVELIITLLLFCHISFAFGYWFTNISQEKMKCSSISSLSSRVGKAVSQCQSAVKSDLIEDLLAPFNTHSTAPLRHYDDHHHHSSTGNIRLPSQQTFHIYPTDFTPLPSSHGLSRVHDHRLVNYHELTNHGIFPQYPDLHHPFHSSVPFEPYNSHVFGSHPIFQTSFPIHPQHEPHHHIVQHHDLHHHDPRHHKTYYHEPHHKAHHEHPDSLPQFSKPIHVVEAHEELSHVLAVNMPKVLHNNHHEISSLLEKLRNEKQENDEQTNEDTGLRTKIVKRSRRSFFDTLRQTDDSFSSKIFIGSHELSEEDRWLAGCLLHCVFRQSYVLDDLGKPTVYGLTKFFTTETTEQALFLHVLRTVNRCLRISSEKNQIFWGEASAKREMCAVAFDLFNCISDSVTEYCS